MTVMGLFAHGDAHRVEVAEQLVSRCMQQLVRAAFLLDRVLVERGDEEGRRRLVAGAMRLAAEGSHSDNAAALRRLGRPG